MSSGNKFHLENNFEDYHYQYDWKDNYTEGIKSALHISYVTDGSLYNRKIFLDVVGDIESPAPLRATRYRAFRTVHMIKNEIAIEMIEQAPQAGRIWLATGTLDNSGKFTWIQRLNGDYWLCLTDPYFYKQSMPVDLSCYEGIELYGTVYAIINAANNTADLNIKCKFDRVNYASQSSGSYNFINCSKLRNSIGGYSLQFPGNISTMVNIENWLYSDATNWIFGYTGLTVAYNAENDSLYIGRYHDINNMSWGAYPTSQSAIYNSDYVFNITIHNITVNFP